MVWVFIVLAVLIAVGIWGVVNPRSLYWTLHAWKYRNPEANEPSDVSYGLTRVSSLVGVVILGVAGVFFFGLSGEQAQAQQCETDQLPPFEDAWLPQDDRDARLEALAAELDLELTREQSDSGVSYEFMDGSRVVMSAYQPSSDVWMSQFAPRCGEFGS